jgi:hypothetical protein
MRLVQGPKAERWPASTYVSSIANGRCNGCCMQRFLISSFNFAAAPVDRMASRSRRTNKKATNSHEGKTFQESTRAKSRQRRAPAEPQDTRDRDCDCTRGCDSDHGHDLIEMMTEEEIREDDMRGNLASAASRAFALADAQMNAPYFDGPPATVEVHGVEYVAARETPQAVFYTEAESGTFDAIEPDMTVYPGVFLKAKNELVLENMIACFGDTELGVLFAALTPTGEGMVLFRDMKSGATRAHTFEYLNMMSETHFSVYCVASAELKVTLLFHSRRWMIRQCANRKARDTQKILDLHEQMRALQHQLEVKN